MSTKGKKHLFPAKMECQEPNWSSPLKQLEKQGETRQSTAVSLRWQDGTRTQGKQSPQDRREGASEKGDSGALARDPLKYSADFDHPESVKNCLRLRKEPSKGLQEPVPGPQTGTEVVLTATGQTRKPMGHHVENSKGSCCSSRNN